MSFIADIFMPKMPAMPQISLPEPAAVPNYDDEERRLQAAKDEKAAALKRKGRRSTILTGSSGLNEISEEEIETKTLLGG
jgi:hypothetical protein